MAKSGVGENLFQMVFSEAQREERECLTLRVAWACLSLVPSEKERTFTAKDTPSVTETQKINQSRMCDCADIFKWQLVERVDSVKKKKEITGWAI